MWHSRGNVIEICHFICSTQSLNKYIVIAFSFKYVSINKSNQSQQHDNKIYVNHILRPNLKTHTYRPIIFLCSPLVVINTVEYNEKIAISLSLSLSLFLSLSPHPIAYNLTPISIIKNYWHKIIHWNITKTLNVLHYVMNSV